MGNILTEPMPVQLTPRETQVAELIADGFTSDEVAKKLFIAKRTVDYHLTSVYEKLRVRNRAQFTRAMMAYLAARTS